MMTAIRIGSAVAMVALATITHQAKAQMPTSIWEGCGENKVSSFAKFMVGPTAARNQNPKATATEGIIRCSEALRGLDAAAPWQRRAALLRSRAKYYVMAQKPVNALNDLDGIAAIEKPDEVYARSFAVSTHMLRAVAELEAGRRELAAKEALEAMRLRPWSERVAQFAYIICSMRDSIPAGEGARWDKLVLLDGTFAERRAVQLARAGDWAGATADWLRAAPVPGEIGQTYVTLPNVRVQGAPGIPVKGVDVQRTVDAVMTAAIAGRADLAEAWLAKLRTNIDAPPPADGMAQRFGATLDPAAQKADLEKRAGLIVVARVAGSGDMAGAAKQLDTMTTMPISAVATAMLHSVAAKAPATTGASLQKILSKIDEHFALDRTERLDRLFDSGILLGDLPDHEEVMLANPYRSAVKFLRANGSSTKLAKDGKTAQVSFFGNKSQPFAIGEMTLLRAAEFTLEQQHKAFRIVANNDYVQTSTMTMYGVAVGQPTVSGASVVMSIEFVDPGTAGAVNAEAVRTELGPIYIKESPEGRV